MSEWFGEYGHFVWIPALVVAILAFAYIGLGGTHNEY